tara:strand:- start:8603 stop:9139 length:537 start_codon:yes stop_codon:yes gene_type:complete
MIFFETQRLTIRRLEPMDKTYFAELFTDPKVLADIPQKPFTENQITDRFKHSLYLDLKDLKTVKCDAAVFEKGKPEMIGLAMFIREENGTPELGYRFRTDYWGKGYGTELSRGMLDFYFNVLKVDELSAHVNIANLASVKILNKFMKPVKEFFNEQDNCIDRRYELEKGDWLKQDLRT